MNNFNAIAFLPIVLLVLSLPLSAQDSSNLTDSLAQVRFTSSKSTIQVAEPFTVQLQVVASAGTQVTLPPLSESLAAFDLIDHQDILDLPTGDSQRLWQRTMTLESINTGEQTIPSLNIVIRRDGQAETIATKEIQVLVSSVLDDRADPTDYRDIRPLINLPSTDDSSAMNSRWWIVCGIAGIIAIGATATVLARRKRKVNPADWAAQQLKSLKQSELVHIGDCEFAYSRLSSILRDYLRLQFELPAQAQTTSEVIAALHDNPAMPNPVIPAEQRQAYEEIFKLADLAKFAGLQMTSEELLVEIDKAQRLMESTSNMSNANTHAK